MFGNKKTESALNVVNQVVKSGNYAQQDGAIVFTLKNGRKTVNTGVIYLHQNKIYAAEIENLPFAMGTRIMSSGALKKSHFETMERQFAGQLNHSGILAYLLQKQQITEQLAKMFYEEYLLSCIEEMFGWNSVVGGWKAGEVYQLPAISQGNTFYQYSLQDLQKALNDRRVLFREFFSLTSRFFKASQLHDLVFLAKRPLEGSVSHEGVRLHELARTGITLNNASRATGMTTNEVFRAMMWFWKADFVDVVLDNAAVSFAAAQKARRLGVGREDELDDLIASETQVTPSDSSFTVVPAMPLQPTQEVVPFEDPVVDNEDPEESELDEDGEKILAERLEEFSEDDDPRRDAGNVFDDEDDENFLKEERKGFFDDLEDPEEVSEEAETDDESPDEANDEESASSARSEEEALPEESPVFRIKQRLDELVGEKEHADLRLEESRRRRAEHSEKVEILRTQLHTLTEQLGEAQHLLTEASTEESQLQQVCDDLELQIAETISTFQYPGR